MIRDGVRVGNQTDGVATTSGFIRTEREKGRRSTFPIRSRTPDPDLTPLTSRVYFIIIFFGNFH